MNTEVEIQRADPRARRTTIAILALATVAALLLVFAFRHWLSNLAATVSTDRLVVQLRHWIGVMMIASAACLLALAGHAARVARRIGEERRWPLAGARLLRDTPVRRDSAALRRARLLDAIAIVFVALAIGAGAIGWRLFVAGT